MRYLVVAMVRRAGRPRTAPQRRPQGRPERARRAALARRLDPQETESAVDAAQQRGSADGDGNERRRSERGAPPAVG
jgi:hypothetical protein